MAEEKQNEAPKQEAPKVSKSFVGGVLIFSTEGFHCILSEGGHSKYRHGMCEIGISFKDINEKKLKSKYIAANSKDGRTPSSQMVEHHIKKNRKNLIESKTLEISNKLVEAGVEQNLVDLVIENLTEQDIATLLH